MPRDRATRWTKTVAIVALPLLLLVGFAVATYTPLFRLRDIRVTGATTLTRADVIARSGLGGDTNVFHLDTGAVQTALEADPWIRSATVERDLPRTVVIDVEERTPIAQALVGTALTPMAIAGDGIVLPGAPVAGLPEIRASVGALSDQARIEAAGALDVLTPVLRARVSDVVADPSGSLVMDLAGGLTVDYGGPGDQVARAVALRSVLAWVAREHVAVANIDLTVPEAPSATLENGSTISP